MTLLPSIEAQVVSEASNMVGARRVCDQLGAERTVRQSDLTLRMACGRWRALNEPQLGTHNPQTDGQEVT